MRDSAVTDLFVFQQNFYFKTMVWLNSEHVSIGSKSCMVEIVKVKCAPGFLPGIDLF